jgi:acyl-CoA reductase-like NAD-dependent aldehyde dehydrogenase
MLATWRVGPALAAGNTVVLKPPEWAPLTASLLADLAHEAGVPPGVVNVVQGTGAAAGAPLTGHPGVDRVAFTGSPATARTVGTDAARALTPVSFELGGKSPFVVFADADLDAAAATAAYQYDNSGEVCLAGTRLLVENEALDPFMERFTARVAEIRVGDPLDEDTTMGPMLTENAAARAVSWLEEAVADGASVLAGGTREGTLFQPTVITGTRPEMRVACEEVFAPVVVLERYEDLDDALAAANATEYGLQAGIFSKDLEVVYRAYRELDVGGVIVNDVNIWRVDSMPYGGVKASGYGREGLRYAIREQTEPKLLVLKL